MLQPQLWVFCKCWVEYNLCRWSLAVQPAEVPEPMDPCCAAAGSSKERLVPCRHMRVGVQP